ncbi:MAG: hypothetical protein K0S02_5379 [Achromobacter mucicolens]|jgi:hypothetical protein|uniref:hypothetical protein n=1 Tax=Achromobacter mucicolens TaxID=1389922 RepID=UPI002431887F|nr:hypothetical protein [Achromobacter mucicolens]MDF2865107.1 hypothetical protein [Achromobacter mucicolens]
MTSRRALVFLLSLLAAPSGAAVVYDNHGLVVDVAAGSRSDWNTGQRQTTRATTITFQGKSLCGADVGALLFPGSNAPQARAFFCPGPVAILETDAVLAFFTSSSASTVLAHLQVVNGALRVQRLPISDKPDRDRIHGTRFEDARLPGWTRVNSAWNETVMIRHAPLKAMNLGPGKLMDVAGDVAYLAVPPGRDVLVLQPATHVKDAHGYLQYVPEVSKFVDMPLSFRAVRLSDGRELARLDFKDTCVGLPALQFERPGAKAASGSSPVIAFDDVPAWRANALELTQAQGRATLRLKPGVALPRKAGCNAS